MCQKKVQIWSNRRERQKTASGIQRTTVHQVAYAIYRRSTPGFANVSIRFGVLWVLTFPGLRQVFVVQGVIPGPHTSSGGGGDRTDLGVILGLLSREGWDSDE